MILKLFYSWGKEKKENKRRKSKKEKAQSSKKELGINKQIHSFYT